jgi:hypothetical protein
MPLRAWVVGDVQEVNRAIADELTLEGCTESARQRHMLLALEEALLARVRLVLSFSEPISLEPWPNIGALHALYPTSAPGLPNVPAAGAAVASANAQTLSPPPVMAALPSLTAVETPVISSINAQHAMWQTFDSVTPAVQHAADNLAAVETPLSSVSSTVSAVPPTHYSASSSERSGGPRALRDDAADVTPSPSSSKRQRTSYSSSGGGGGGGGAGGGIECGANEISCGMSRSSSAGTRRTDEAQEHGGDDVGDADVDAFGGAGAIASSACADDNMGRVARPCRSSSRDAAAPASGMREVEGRADYCSRIMHNTARSDQVGPGGPLGQSGQAGELGILGVRDSCRDPRQPTDRPLSPASCSPTVD